MTIRRRDFIGGLLGTTALLAKAKTLNLKIESLKTFVVNAGTVNWVFCKVYTNQGLVGLGEGSVTSKEATVAQAIMDNERLLAGKNPADIEYLWQSMFRNPRWRGGPILTSAISAIEIALWDVLGQALETPIYRLLGGAARERIRMYVDVAATPEAYVRVKEAGYTAAKSALPSADHGLIRPNSAVRQAVRTVEALRKAVGDDFDICIDAHGRLTTTMAIDFCTSVEEFRPLFVEEPTQLEDLGELALLREKTKVPLATGERLFTRYGFADICSRHLVDYVQPDVCHAGGISELKKIGAFAETYRIAMAPHNPQSHVSTLASLHVDATTPNSVIQESTVSQEQWRTDLFDGNIISVKDGYASLPSKPGLGVTLNENVAAKHPYKPINRGHYAFGDGSIADQ
jgi:L-alanine-DL-glutamate epimerase-like enolase superfamily enzyme